MKRLPYYGSKQASSEEEIFQIFSQAAETINSELRVINYFPGEIYGRMKELDTLCKKEKEVDPTFKYQIRCGYDDLTLRVKTGGAINWVEKPLNTFGPLNDFKLVFYRGNKSWEEKSPAKGRRGKRMRSEEKSPVRPLKKHNTENCSPTAADNTPTSVAASTPGISQKS